MGVGFMAYNRNKKSLALNLKSDEGRDLYRSLVAKSDVVVENLRPGSVDRMGLGYEALSELNPGLVYAAVSGLRAAAGAEGAVRGLAVVRRRGGGDGGRDAHDRLRRQAAVAPRSTGCRISTRGSPRRTA